MNKEEILKRMGKAIVEGNKDEAEALANEAIKQRLDLNEVIDKGYVPGILPILLAISFLTRPFFAEP